MTTFRCIDTETTGIPSETERHAMVEAGWCDVVGARGDEFVMEPYSMLVNPGRHIPAEASAIHHIRDVNVRNAPSPDAACAAMGAAGDYYVAHKADFEKQFFGGGGKPFICTWKGALRVFPDAPAHKLQVLRYHLDFDSDPLFDPTLADPPHRAGPDAYVDSFLLLKLLEAATVEQLVKWSTGPALLVRFDFGKHYGKTWAWCAENDRTYLHWVDDNILDDRDKRATARYWLKKPQPQQPGATQ